MPRTLLAPPPPQLHGPTPGLAAAASRRLAFLSLACEGDLTRVPRELAAKARRLAMDGDHAGAVAIFDGLLSVGDRRIVDIVGPCWRHLCPEAWTLLAERAGTRPYAALVDWLVTWLGEAEGEEFATVGQALVRIARLKRRDALMAVGLGADEFEGRWDLDEPAGIFDISGRDAASAQWLSLAEYGARITPRLLALAADGAHPRVIWDLMLEWGVHQVPPAEEEAAESEATGPGPEPTYGEAYAALLSRLAASWRNADSPARVAGLYGAAMVGQQLASLERAGRGRGPGLRRALRTPWALGYLRGVALAMVGWAGIPLESSEVGIVFTEVHRAALGRTLPSDGREVPPQVRTAPAFAAGLTRGGRDSLGYSRGEKWRAGLYEWLRVQVGDLE